MESLDVLASIETPLGWLDLQDPDNGYELDGTAFADKAVSHRKIEVSSGWMEGTFVVRSVRENVSEALVVQVRGNTAGEFDARVKALTDALDQISYQVKVSFGTAEQTWQCTVADYSVATSREFRFSHYGVVKATVPRLPEPTYATLVP